MELSITNRQLQMLEKLNLPKIGLTNITMLEFPFIERGYSALLQTDVVSKSAPSAYNELIVNEAFVGLFGTNTILSLTPNFMQVYSYVLSRNCKIGNEMELCSTIYTQYIKGIDFDDFFLTSNLADYKAVLLQTILALALAHEKFGFIHNDLHSGNIIIRVLNEPYNTVFNNQIITRSLYQPVMIDFGRSTIIVNNKRYNITANDKNISTWQDDITSLLSLHYDVNYVASEREVKRMEAKFADLKQKYPTIELVRDEDIKYDILTLENTINDYKQRIIDRRNRSTIDQKQKLEIHRLLYQILDETNSMEQFFLDSLQILKI